MPSMDCSGIYLSHKSVRNRFGVRGYEQSASEEVKAAGKRSAWAKLTKYCMLAGLGLIVAGFAIAVF
jgi:hypothetical protein